MTASIKIRELDVFQEIMKSCFSQSSQGDEAPNRFSQVRKMTEHRETQQKGLIRSFSKIQVRKKMSNNILYQSHSLERRKEPQSVQLQDKFCGGIVVAKQDKPIFRQVVQKYKRNYHPSNASSGSRDMTR